MSSTQYDLPEKVIKLFRLREIERQKNKAYFMKMISNPHRFVDEGLTFTDPQHYRFNAAHAYQYEFFKPTTRSMTYTLCVVGLPIMATAIYLFYTKSKEEAKYRAGLVAYSDSRYRRIF